MTTPKMYTCERATTCKEFCAHCGPIDTLRYARELYCLRVKQFVMFDEVQEQDEPQIVICSHAAECISAGENSCISHYKPHEYSFACDGPSACPDCVPVEQPPDPVDEPQPVDLDAIRDRVKQSRTTHWLSTVRERAREMCTTVIDSDVPAMCAEIERLRRDLAASRQEVERLKNVVMIRDAMLDGMRQQRDELRAYWDESLNISGALAEDVVSLTYERDELKVKLDEAQRAIGELVLGSDEVTG